MADEQEIEIEVKSLDEPGAKSETKTDAGTKVEPTGGDDAFVELKRQYDDVVARDSRREQELAEARRREAEERQRADTATIEAGQARSYAENTQLNAIITALDAAKAEADAAERELQTAFEAGDAKRVAEAQRRVSRAEANQVALERDKQFVESRQAQVDADRVASEGRVREQQPRRLTQDEANEAFVNSQPRHIADWLRNHMDVLTDPEMRLKAQAADLAAKKSGHNPRSDGYIPFVEEYLYGNQSGGSQVRQTQQRQTAPARQRVASAPPSRGANGSGNGGRISVRLTPEQQRSAVDGTIVWNTGPNKGKPIGVDEMARRVVIDTQNGKYDRIFRR